MMSGHTGLRAEKCCFALSADEIAKCQLLMELVVATTSEVGTWTFCPSLVPRSRVPQTFVQVRWLAFRVPICS